jgi:SanA protein
MKKKIIKIAAAVFIFVLIVIIVCNILVSNSTKNFVYDNPKNIPYNEVGLLLGTSKFLKNGRINEYWKNRIDATFELYKLKKIKFVIISGDNGKSTYDEPTDMKKELVKLGIPASAIFLDYAGFRTFDSMIRAQKIFSQQSFTVISQRFHNERAIYIGQHYGIKAIGYNAKDVAANKGFKTNLREIFARVKLFIDFVIDKQPKFLGEKVEIK